MSDLSLPRHHYDSIIFDIDGTLWNAAQSTADAWTEVFARHRIPLKVSKKDIESVAGRPYLDCLKIVFRDYDQFQEKEALLRDLAVAEKRTMQSLGGELYEGVLDGIRELAGRYPLYLVSNCQDWYLESFLQANGIGRFFKDSTCFGLTSLPKATNILALIEKHQLKRPVYIGDTSGDRKASAEAGVDYIHVEYGFERSTDGRGFLRFPDLVAHLLVTPR